MRRKKWYRETKKSMEILLSKVPPLKKHSEKEMEELIHRARVMERKKQIALVRLDTEIPFEPFNMSQYTTPKRQIHFLKVVWIYIVYGVLLIKELKP